ncbi:hypothetical protein D6783_04810 [Candidatus Woesearchaeota archaeon]|nr:MAG: hypothetical protein D6783_04810 [Candidatus Woesearchaeota archaeon]
MSLYCKRIVNINVNIVLASALAAVLTAPIIEVLEEHLRSIALVVLSSLVIDAIFDFSIFSLLHWFANKSLQGTRFLRDVLTLQKQRVFLTPLFYGVATGTQTALLVLGRGAGFSVVVAYFLAILVTRCVHTLYGLKCGLFVGE